MIEELPLDFFEKLLVLREKRFIPTPYDPASGS